MQKMAIDLNLLEWGGSGIERYTFEVICSLVAPGSHILELGSGKISTAAFSTQLKVTSIDDNENYIGLFPDVNYIHAPLVDGWYDVQILKQKIPGDYDIIFVDAPCGSGNRMGFLHNFYEKCA